MKRAYPDAEIDLLKSSGGVFEVTVDGVIAFSKKTIGRHAQPGEILGLIRGKRT